jgi:hypothetical protein
MDPKLLVVLIKGEKHKYPRSTELWPEGSGFFRTGVD